MKIKYEQEEFISIKIKDESESIYLDENER